MSTTEAIVASTGMDNETEMIPSGTMNTATMDGAVDITTTVDPSVTMYNATMGIMTTIDPCSLATIANNSCGNNTNMMNVTMPTRRQSTDPTQENVVYAVTTTIIAIGMIGIGATVHYRTMWNYMKKPKAYILGVLMQLLILPPLAWTLTKIFVMPFGEALGVFIQGCSPGGTTSNLVVYWLDGIVDLSVVMTLTTTVLALGTMPLWLFIYTTGETLGPEYQVPYDRLAISLVVLVVPLLIGMFIKVWLPKHAEKISKVCIISASIMILIMLVVRSVISQIPWIVSWRQGVVAAIMPLVAFMLGYLVTLFPYLKLDGKRKRTIALETALQNVQVAAAVITISYGSQPRLLIQMIVFPLLYYVFQVGYSAVFAGLYIFGKKKGWVNLDQEEDEDNPENGNIPIHPIDSKGKVNPGFENDTKNEVNGVTANEQA